MYIASRGKLRRAVSDTNLGHHSPPRNPQTVSSCCSCVATRSSTEPGNTRLRSLRPSAPVWSCCSCVATRLSTEPGNTRLRSLRPSAPVWSCCSCVATRSSTEPGNTRLRSLPHEDRRGGVRTHPGVARGKRRMAEVDGNRTRRTRITRPNRFEGGGAHQVLVHLRGGYQTLPPGRNLNYLNCRDRRPENPKTGFRRGTSRNPDYP